MGGIRESHHNGNGDKGNRLLIGTTVNICKSMIGTGSLLMPMCFSRLGLFAGLLLSLLCAFLNLVTLLLVGQASIRCGARDYLQLASKEGNRVIEAISVSLVSLVALAPLLVTIRQSSMYIHNVFNSVFGFSPTESAISVFFCVFALWPMSFVTSPRVISRASSVGMLGMLYICFLIVFDWLSTTILFSSWISASPPPVSSELLKNSESVGGENLLKDLKNVLDGHIFMVNPSISARTIIRCTNTFLFSLSGHLTIPSLCAPLHNTPHVDSLNCVIAFSVFFALLFQISLASTSYLTFASKTPGDALDARPGNYAYILAQLFIIIVNVASFPVVLMPIYSLLDWFKRAISQKPSDRSYRHISLDLSDPPHEESSDFSSKRSLISGFSIILFGLLLSSCFAKLGDIFDVIGSLTTGILFVSLPALFSINKSGGPNPRILLLVILGLLLTLCSIVGLLL